MGTILLFYKYVDITYPVEIQNWQKQLCIDLGLTGRIILAHEGINGTVGGTDEATQQYIQAMNEHPLFGGIDFKTADGDSSAFPRMKVCLRKEIVHLGIDPKDLTVQNTGEHLTPAQAHDLITQQSQDLVILDGRNNYEAAVGKFEGAITPDIRYFRQFPQYVDENIDQFKDKTVLMYCTGGIRCERASAYLQTKGIAKKVYQIEGGIHRYVQQFPDGYFRGKNYVFDQRVTVRVNEDILGSCLNCSMRSDDYYNCLNALCNKHFLSCTLCLEKFSSACSQQCQFLLMNKQTPERVPLQKI